MAEPATFTAHPRKRLALIAHERRKQDMLDCAVVNRVALAEHELYAMRTTGRLVAEALELPVTCLLSGPLGGDQQVGAGIAEGRLDCVVFFWDSLEPSPTTWT
jgi:methylglyoxal synthase